MTSLIAAVGGPMSGEFLVRKLQSFEKLSAESITALETIGQNRLRTIKAREDVISEGDDPREVYLITNGWACRYKLLEDGRRQIMAFFLPGDIADLHVYILREMDHSIGALTPLTVARISARELDEVGDAHPRILRALWWDTLVTASIQREWTVSLGQRNAVESLAHLFCELYLRMHSVGLCGGNSCNFPLTHQHLADALGLTPTHIGRVLGKLRSSKLITFEKSRLTVHDLPGLKKIAAFNPNYLHQSDLEKNN